MARLAIAALCVLIVAALAACGGDDDGESLADCAASPGSERETVLIVAELKDVGQVLTLADCTPLYVNDVDTEKRVRCTGQCSRVWTPVRLPKDGRVTTRTPGPIGLVTFVKRPDGGQQAALNGKPLYTYAEESGEAPSGDGVTETFGGTEFTWSVMSLAEAGPQPGQGGGASSQPGQGAGPLGPGQPASP